MIKKGLIVVVSILLVITIYYLYDQSNTYPTPQEAVKENEELFPVQEIVLTTMDGRDISKHYTIYVTEIDEPGNYYAFALTKKKLRGWKVVDSIGGFHISKSNANSSYSYYGPMELIHGITDGKPDCIMIGDRRANIVALPNSDLSVWYQIGLTEEEATNVRFLDENGEEIK